MVFIPQYFLLALTISAEFAWGCIKFDSYSFWKMCCEGEKFAKKEQLEGRTAEGCPGSLLQPFSQRSVRQLSPSPLLESCFPYSFIPFSEHLTAILLAFLSSLFSFCKFSGTYILKVSDCWLETPYSEMVAPSQDLWEGLAVGMAGVVWKQLNQCSTAQPVVVTWHHFSFSLLWLKLDESSKAYCLYTLVPQVGN